VKPNTARFYACSWVIAGFIATAVTGDAKDTPQFVRIAPADIQWRDVRDGHGVQQAILFGDPEKSGIYVVRVRFPPRIMDVPHWHPNDRYVTVLEGTWYTGTGETFDFAKAIALKAGSVMLHPGRAAHWDGAGSNDAVVVQIIGVGPGSSTQVDPSKPFWMEVPH
jgi:quercetin dioxygenase-like cupin family protein